MENTNAVRILRSQPFMWSSKTPLRVLRAKYKKQKPLYRGLRGTYLGLCEIDSDFSGKNIRALQQTLETYTGLDRKIISRSLKLLKDTGFISYRKVRKKGQFTAQSEILMLEVPMGKKIEAELKAYCDSVST